jgi:glycosyltransferase involved in cell wall biosynthesis
VGPTSSAPKRRVLIVTGSYAPAMVADMHRARQLAWHLPALAWNVDILCPDETYQPPASLDQDSAEFFAPDIPVHSVPQSFSSIFRGLGIGSIGPRAILPMLRAGQRLLRTRRYDLVYVTTAQVLLFLLGPMWRRQFGTPFVLDLHDPISRDEAQMPHGLKHRMSRALAKHVEAGAVKAASGLISVSPSYLDQLHQRYGKSNPKWMSAGRRAVIPFSILPHDLEEAARTAPARSDDGRARIVYVGTGGPLMVRSFSLLCRALSQLRARHDDRLEHLRLELYGTASVLGRDFQSHLARIASDAGVPDIVSEDPRRVTYRRSLELLSQGDGALILGVDDAGYMPSKLFTYASAGKPLLASLRRDSPAYAAFQQNPQLGRVLWFDHKDEMPIASAANTLSAFLADVTGGRQFDRKTGLAPYSALAMAKRHADVFAACLE